MCSLVVMLGLTFASDRDILIDVFRSLTPSSCLSSPPLSLRFIFFPMNTNRLLEFSYTNRCVFKALYLQF